MSESSPPPFPSSTSSSEQRKRQRHRRIKPKNPFGRRYQREDRDNFPNMDSFFRNPVDQSLCSFQEEEEENDDENEIGDFDDNDDGGSSSVLNMSIGARAALNEHMRYVARFGIDGENNHHASASTRCHHSTSSHNNSNNTSNNDADSSAQLLDEQWENLLLGCASGGGDNDNFSTTTISRGNSAAGSIIGVVSSPSPGFDVLVLEGDNDESIEVMTDMSHDFFNSSRIQLLGTPERNWNRSDHVSTRREGELEIMGSFFEHDEVQLEKLEEEDYGCFETVSSSGGHNRLAPELRIMSSPHSSSYRNDSSFNSLGAVDISHISKADDSLDVGPMRRSPNTSFQVLDDVALSPILDDIASPSRSCIAAHLALQETSSSSSSSRQSQRRIRDKSNATNNDLPMAVGSSLHSSAKPSSVHLRKKPPGEKENYFPSAIADVCVYYKREPGTSLPVLPARGSAELVAGVEIVQPRHLRKDEITPRKILNRQSNARAHRGGGLTDLCAVETMPADFLKAIDESSTQGKNISPISQVDSQTGHELSSGRSSSSSAQRQMESTANLNSNYNQCNVSSSSSSSSHLAGRKLFRTVVPRRVYLDASSPSQFPEEHDSFSTPKNSSSSSGDNAIRRSLLESFDAALDS